MSSVTGTLVEWRTPAEARRDLPRGACHGPLQLPGPVRSRVRERPGARTAAGPGSARLPLPGSPSPWPLHRGPAPAGLAGWLQGNEARAARGAAPPPSSAPPSGGCASPCATPPLCPHHRRGEDCVARSLFLGPVTLDVPQGGGDAELQVASPVAQRPSQGAGDPEGRRTGQGSWRQGPVSWATRHKGDLWIRSAPPPSRRPRDRPALRGVSSPSSPPPTPR